MTPRTLPRYLSKFTDRHGKTRYRFRGPGGEPNTYIPFPFGTPAFWARYAELLQGADLSMPNPPPRRNKPGSIDDLVERYYRSREWLGMGKESSRRTYRGIIERFRAKHGEKKVANVRFEHLDAILGEMSATPAAANNLRKVLRRLFAYAVKAGLRNDNPALLTDPYSTDSEGFHTWTEAEIAKFEAAHPTGSKPRLAMALLLWTGQRRSDVVGMGRQHIDKGRLRIRQQKTGAAVTIPIMAGLRAELDQLPADQMIFVLTEFGRPFTAAGFGNWFRKQCTIAGLPNCSAHGLRKAMSRRLAEAGATHSEGKAVTGHKSDREFTRYAAEASREQLADTALANLEVRLAKNPPKPLKKGA